MLQWHRRYKNTIKLQLCIKIKLKKHFKFNKSIINCYRYPYVVNNMADNANRYK